jgi:hypothetical protein
LLRAGRLFEAHIEHISDEIESMGKSEKRELVSNGPRRLPASDLRGRDVSEVCFSACVMATSLTISQVGTSAISPRFTS